MYNSVSAIWYPMRASLGAELQAVIGLSMEDNEKKGRRDLLQRQIYSHYWK